MVETAATQADRDKTVTELKRLGAHPVFVRMAKAGQIIDIRCETPKCYCPKGRGYFEGGQRRGARRDRGRLALSRSGHASVGRAMLPASIAGKGGIAMTLKAVVWNMAQKPRNWDVLDEWQELKDADISLLCEAPPAPVGVEALGRGSTEGLEIALASDQTVNRPWSTAIASSRPMDPITDARVDRYYGEPLPFEPSRPGTWTAASVDVDGMKVTAISLYGLMDERSDSSVHRSLSELSPIFDHKDYGKRLLLGGDLNILGGRPAGAHLDRHQVVLGRIKAYGLVDCLEKAVLERDPPRGGLPNCQCGLNDDCTHTWTKLDPKRPTIPYQDDYLFASRRLAERLGGCVALEFTEDSPSDHAPIVATFKI